MPSYFKFSDLEQNNKRDDDFKPRTKDKMSSPLSMFSQVPTRILRLVGLSVCALVFVFLFLRSSGDSAVVVSDATKAVKTAPASAVDAVVDAVSADPLTCTKSFDGVTPITQYVVMIDAGSSGSRIHVYKFNNCQSTPRLLDEHFVMDKPGLSAFTDPEEAAQSLDKYLDSALEYIPEEYHSCSPLQVKATAGLRMVGEQKAKEILQAVHDRIQTKYPFPIAGEDGVGMMSDSDEGVYAWITINYLLGKIGSPEKKPTVAAFDLGGGSTQIVFEPELKGDKKPTAKQIQKAMQPGDHVYDLKFGDLSYSLYQKSHLGYGLNAAKEQMYKQVVMNHINSDDSVVEDGVTLVNPCVPSGLEVKNVKVKINAEKTYTVNFRGPSKPQTSAQCRKIAEDILHKDHECTVEPCAFNGVYMPSLAETFLREYKLYIISFFYDRTAPLGMPSDFSVEELQDVTQRVCLGEYDSFKAIPGAISELKENPAWCMELTYMVSLLHQGYEIPVSREVTIAKKIKDYELGWCLGASLPLLHQNGKDGWTCKLKKQ